METTGSFYGDWLEPTGICMTPLKTNRRRRPMHSRVMDKHILFMFRAPYKKLQILLVRSL